MIAFKRYAMEIRNSTIVCQHSIWNYHLCSFNNHFI